MNSKILISKITDAIIACNHKYLATFGFLFKNRLDGFRSWNPDFVIFKNQKQYCY